MSNEVKLVFAGDSQQLERTFAKVGSSAQEMATDVDKSSKRLAKSTEDAGGGIANAVDGSEAKFRGLGDVIGGTGDVMDGFRSGNVAQMAMGFADLAGGLSSLVIPAITAMRTALMTGLAPALTAISAHPLIAGILAGGAIIAGLVLLEKKFGVVSTALGFLKSAAETALSPIIGIVQGFRDLWNNTIGGKGFSFGGWDPPGPGPTIPGFSLRIPTLHTGGIAGRDTLAMLQQGETVIPRGQSAGGGLTIIVQGSVITERDLGRVIQDALRNNKLIGVTA